MGDDDWKLTAACRDMNPSTFFPSGDSVLDDVLAICERCPHTGVDGPCYAYAVRNREDQGVWGGELFGVSQGRSARRVRKVAVA